jgi:hypothetical protein
MSAVGPALRVAAARGSVRDKRAVLQHHRALRAQALLADRFVLGRFSFVDDAGDLHLHPELDDTRIDRNVGCRDGRGIFELAKLSPT